MDARSLVDEAISREIEALKPRLSELRETPVDKLVLYVKMKLALKALARDEGILASLEEALAESLGLKLKHPGGSREGLVEYFQPAENLWRRLGRSRRLTASRLLSESSSRDEVLTYIWLRRSGVLKKRSDGSLIASRVEAQRSLSNERCEVALEDISRYLKEVSSSLWSKVITRSLLENASTSELVSLAGEYYGFNASVDARITEELRKRILNGWKPAPSDARRLEDALRDALKGVTGVEVPLHLLPYIDTVEEYVAARRERLAREIERLPLKERWSILRSLRRKVRDPGFYESLNPITLMDLKGLGGLSEPLAGKVALGEAIGSYLEYLLTGDASYKTYALHVAERIDASILDPRYKPVLESIINGDDGRLLFLLGREMSLDALELISIKLGDEYSRRGILDPVLVKKAVVLGLRLLNYMRKKAGLPQKRKAVGVKGRLEVRETMYKWVRFNYNSVFKGRVKRRRLIGVVDVSGSMARFSLWSILSLAFTLPATSHVVVFSEEARVYKLPSRKTVAVLAGFLEKLYTEGFKGYTNISRALRVAGELALKTGSKTLLLFSDLKQTVPGEEPWSVAGSLTSKGLRIVALTPYTTSDVVAEKYRSAGCDVVAVENPESIPIILKRKISLKK